MKSSLFSLFFTLVLGVGPISAAKLINGSGATFPYPLYSKWFSEYQKVDPTVMINYQSIGSGGGIRQFTDKTVHFGASDAPMTNEQLQVAPDTIHIPTVLGAVVLTYNLPNTKAGSPLKLNGEIIADIYLEKITKWNDPKIAKLNAETLLPDLPLMVVHRSDGSGTSNIFTDYLSKVSKEWKTKVGTGTAVNWPTGLGGKGNEGVTGLVKQNIGSIGYVELIYAENNHLPSAALQNKAGRFVKPTVHSVTEAAASVLQTMPEDFRVSITNAEGATAYPVSGFTYLLIRKTMDKETGSKIVSFLKWAIHEGQKYAEPLAYSPLPQELIKKVDAKINEIQLK